MWINRAGVLAIIAILFIAPISASAHASPVAYTPAAGSTVLTTPSSISVRFTERIEVGASSLKVYGPSGAELQVNKGTINPDDGRELTVPIKGDKEGVYTVSWQVVSVDDGHFTKGAFSFLVDATGKKFTGDAGGIQVAYSSKITEALLSFFNLVGESLFIAVVLFAYLLYMLRKKQKTLISEEQRSLTPVFLHTTIIASLLFISASVLEILRKTSELASLQETSFLPALQTYLHSSVGTFLAMKIAVAGIFTLIFLIFRKKLFSAQPMAVIFTLSLCMAAIVYMQSQLSHAAASFFYPKLSVFITFVHLSAKELIIGSLLVLSACMYVFVHTRKYQLLALYAKYFNAVASIALFLAAASGVYITWLHLKHFDNFTATEWGTRFIMLLCATVALGAFRLAHQFIITQKILSSVFFRKLFFITLPVEAALGLLVLFYSGYISITTPPFTVLQYTFAQDTVSENMHIHFDVHPYEKDSFRIVLTDPATAKPAEVKGLVVTAFNPEKNIGPNILVAEKRFDGGYVFPRANLSPEGTWEIGINVQQESGYDAHAQFSLAYPGDIDATKVSDDKRSLNEFAFICIGIAICAMLFCMALFAHALLSLKKHEVMYVPDKDSYTVAMLCGSSAFLACVCFVLVFGAYGYITKSTFKAMCLYDKQQWHQAFPTRYSEPVSPNALYGCFVHNGHFHFVDEREYLYFKATEKL